MKTSSDEALSRPVEVVGNKASKNTRRRKRRVIAVHRKITENKSTIENLKAEKIALETQVKELRGLSVKSLFKRNRNGPRGTVEFSYSMGRKQRHNSFFLWFRDVHGQVELFGLFAPILSLSCWNDFWWKPHISALTIDTKISVFWPKSSHYNVWFFYSLFENFFELKAIYLRFYMR